MAKVDSYSLSSHIPAVHPLFHLPSPSSYKSLPCLGEPFFLLPNSILFIHPPPLSPYRTKQILFPAHMPTADLAAGKAGTMIIIEGTWFITLKIYRRKI